MSKATYFTRSSLIAGASKKYATAVINLMPPPNHSTLINPPSLLISHPLMIAPIKSRITDAARLFRRTLFVAKSLKSPIKSQYVEVKTLTGNSLKPSNRDVAICMPA